MELIVHNSLSKRLEVFRPRNGKIVKLFTCGPSVYRKQHIGNFRTFVFEDVLQKYLGYLGYSVQRVLNFTNLEDKAIAEAGEKGIRIEELTAPVIEQFYDDANALELFIPKEIPTSTNSVDQAVKLIRELMENGHAYRHNNNIYYDPLTYSKFGEVYGLDMSKWPKKKVRFSKDTYRGQRWNRGDFILWHGAKDDDGMYWDTVIGRGRPAWNVQDPAMITKQIGYEIDIHCGGIDNLIRHHDYNRAVVEGAGKVEFCPYWMHAEHLIIDGEKMSKSKGNTRYPEDFLKDGLNGPELRFELLYGHYRDKHNLTDERIKQNQNFLHSLKLKIKSILDGHYKSGETEKLDKRIDELPVLFNTYMSSDLQVRKAVDAISALISEIAKYKTEEGIGKKQADRLRDELEKIDTVLGVLFA